MKTVVRAQDVATLLDDAPEGLRCLSLDCFDTLLWRNVHQPTDVFADLPFAGGGIEPRVNGERAARALRIARDTISEVSIEAIYQQLMPTADEPMRAEAIAHELAAEARHCFAFAPTVALIRAAKARGLTVIVVSDTYLSEPQLRTLIGQAAGTDVMAMIDRVFCSSEHGLTKAQGLFRPVLAAMEMDPFAILHLGDNPAADEVAPRALGIRSVHLQQFGGDTEQRLRLEAAAAALIDPAIRISRPAFQPHRAQIALRGDADAATVVGHDVLGPILHCFAEWVRDEAEALSKSSGRPVKTLFLLRDGHLPQQAFAAAGFGTAAAVSISRFTARAAAFRDEQSVRAYLHAEQTERVDVLGRQLLLTDAEIKQLGRNHRQFRREVVSPRWINKICTRSRAFAERLAMHIRKEGGVAPGDAIMLVDLGYAGSVQDHVEGVLVEQLQVQVAGRYLLLRERCPSGLDKKGLLDTRHFETRMLNALCGPIAVMEQLCTIAEGSVIDYHPNGKPIRKAAGVKGAQSATRDAVQAACLRFVREHGVGMHTRPLSDDADCRRQLAASVLARLLFLPMAEEVALLQRFDHDVNLGTHDLIKLVDTEAAGEQLRRRGLTYITQADRMYLPGEVQGQGFPLALSLFSVGRFGLELRQKDFAVGTISVPLLIASATGQTATTAEAHPTHDGYYLMTAPAGRGEYAVGVQLGAVAEVVQVDELAFYAVEDFHEFGSTPVATPRAPVYDAMEAIAPGVLRCDPNGLVFVPPPGGEHDGPLLLAIVFRPVVRRTNQQSLRKAA